MKGAIEANYEKVAGQLYGFTFCMVMRNGGNAPYPREFLMPQDGRHPME